MLKSVKILMACSMLLGCEIVYASPQDLNTYISTDSDWLLSNIAHYQYTALVEIGTGYRQNRYNLFSYFQPLSSYRYQAKVIEVFQGDKTITPTCVIQPLESKTTTTSNLTGKRIVSFDKVDECIVMDVSVYPLATPDLIDLARTMSKPN